MILIRTAKIKLNIPEGDILPTVLAYTKAYNFVCKDGYDKKIKNGVVLHNRTYQDVREYLPSQLAVSSRMKATESIKSVLSKKNKKSKNKYPKCPNSKLQSIRYDKNSYTLFIKTGELSILTIDGRKRYKLDIPEYFKHFFQDWKNTSADLCIKDHKVYLHIVFEKDITDIPTNGTFVGIDRGINNIAVSSNNKFYGGRELKQLVYKHRRLRSKLQAKGTKSAKRHLKKLRLKEKRFRADINHQISKEIVSSLNPGDTIVLEDLSGIRNQKKKGKKLNNMINNWSFFQLEQFIIYKAAAKGIKVVFIDARYTSQRCSCCGFICKSNRKGDHFNCKQCGFKLNSDLNAARNIRNKHLAAISQQDGAAVNQPIASVEISDASQRLSVVGS